MEPFWNLTKSVPRPEYSALAEPPSPAWIRERPPARGLLQREAASQVGVGKSTWKAWEHGRNPVAKRYWRKVTALLAGTRGP